MSREYGRERRVLPPLAVIRYMIWSRMKRLAELFGLSLIIGSATLIVNGIWTLATYETTSVGAYFSKFLPMTVYEPNLAMAMIVCGTVVGGSVFVYRAFRNKHLFAYGRKYGRK